MAITLSTLLGALGGINSDAAMMLELPDGAFVPAHFHVTEVGRVRKDFIDCGGAVRSWERCVLQVWVAGDVEHRIAAGKLAHIIGLARPRILGDGDLAIEVEYDVGVITQFELVAIEPAADGTLVLRLGGKHTACLAPDRCGDPVPSSGATGAAGCCAPAASEPVMLGVRR